MLYFCSPSHKFNNLIFRLLAISVIPKRWFTYSHHFKRLFQNSDIIKLFVQLDLMLNTDSVWYICMRRQLIIIWRFLTNLSWKQLSQCSWNLECGSSDNGGFVGIITSKIHKSSILCENCIVDFPVNILLVLCAHVFGYVTHYHMSEKWFLLDMLLLTWFL